MADIELLKRLAEAAAQGEYESKQDWDDGELFNVLAPTDLRVKAGPVMKTIATCNDPEQAEFFAAANPAAVLALIAENEALRKENAGLRRREAGRDDGAEIVCAIQSAELEQLRAERDQLKAENERLGKHADCLDRLVVANKALADSFQAERDRLRDENERLARFEEPWNEWHQKTEWIQKTAEPHELGMHRADVLRKRIDRLGLELERVRADAERYQWARRPESGNALFTMVSIGECGPNMDAAIDAAMGKGGKADG